MIPTLTSATSSFLSYSYHFFFFFKILDIYLFIDNTSLPCCTGATFWWWCLGVSPWWRLVSRSTGPGALRPQQLCWGLRTHRVQSAGSAVVVHRFGFPAACGPRDPTRVLCIGRQIPNHLTTREFQPFLFVMRTFKIYSPSNTQVYIMVLLAIIIMLYIRCPNLLVL